MSLNIVVAHVYKQFQTVGAMNIRYVFQHAIKFMRPKVHDPATTNPYVLKDINFTLSPGESIGIIGHNGSGKTTLLRLLAGVSLPTKGRIRVEGRVIPMLSLGAGFHNELTGIENLKLNCSLMGLTREQTRERIISMVDFADIGDYIDMPVKRYSSGMMARLGFAAAIHLDPEIILLDEILAVGDYNFAVKSMAAIREFVSKGTLVLVSHDLGSVEKLCSRVIWLDHGTVKADGPATEVIYQYTKHQQSLIAPSPDPAPAESEPEGASQPEPSLPVTTSAPADNINVRKEQFDPNVIIKRVSLHNRQGQPVSEYGIPDDIIVRCQVRFLKPTPDVRIVIGLIDIEYTAVVTACDNQQLSEKGYSNVQGTIEFEAVFPQITLRPRNFGIWVGISNPVALMPLATWRDVDVRFYVTGKRRDPALHYFAPQGDIIFVPGVSMSYRAIETSEIAAISFQAH